MFSRLRLKKRRRALGLTCEQVGNLAGLSGGTVSHIERGSRKSSAETLAAVADALKQAEADKVATPGLVPESIRPRRKQAGLTLEQLADKAGVSKRTVWWIERGQFASKGRRVDIGPRGETLKNIDAALQEAEARATVDIGAELRAARLKAGLRQDDLEDLTGLSQSTIHLIESGRSKPKPQTLKKLWAALEIKRSTALVGENLRRRRLELRLNCEQFAEEVGISLKTLRRAEKGELRSAIIASRIAEALDRLAKDCSCTKVPSGDDLMQRRLAARVSRTELARRVGISLNAVRNLEKGHNVARLRTVRGIEKGLEDINPPVQSPAKLYPNQSKAARAWRRKKTGGTEEPKIIVQDGPEAQKQLSSTDHALLDALLDLKAFTSAMRQTSDMLAQKAGLNDCTIRHAGIRLKAEGLVESRRGCDGGMWLTPAGLEAARGFRR